MKKLLFASVVDATVNRFVAFFANVFLRRLATHVVAHEAMDISAMEERIAQLEEQGRPIAASRLSSYLEEFRNDDPTYAASTCFARQLLADSFEVDTPALRGEPEDEEQRPRRGRPRKSNGRLADSAK